MTTNNEKLAGLGMYANNNVSQSVFRGLIENMTKYSVICLTHREAMSQSKWNRDFAKELVCARRKKTNLSLYFYFIY